MISTTQHIKLLMKVLIVFGTIHHASAEVSIKLVEDNLTITSTTDAFGSAPEVVLHDDFDSGVANQQLSGWSLGSTSRNQNPVYSDAFSITGKLSGMSSFLNGNYNSSAEYKNLPDMETAYLSYYFKVDKLGPDASRNIKLARLSGGYNGVYIQSYAIGIFDIHSNGIVSLATDDNAESKFKTVWISDYANDSWHRAEMYVKLSNPQGTPTGVNSVRINGKSIFEGNNLINEETNMRYKWLTLPYYVAHDPGSDYKIYYDNVVVSKNRARVELCENDSYNDCKQPVIAKTVSWSPKSITIAKESLSLTKPYIFIFNENDSIVGKAIHYCPDCPSKPKTSP